MNSVRTLGLGLLVAALAVTGCGPQATPRADDRKDKAAKGKDAGKKDEDVHSHGKGPNDGVVFDLGKYHGELTIDHKKKEVMVLVLGPDAKTPKAVAAKDLTVTTKQAKTKKGEVVEPMTIKLEPRDARGGRASKYVGTDPGLGLEADHEGTVVGEIDGKPVEGKFKEE